MSDGADSHVLIDRPINGHRLVVRRLGRGYAAEWSGASVEGRALMPLLEQLLGYRNKTAMWIAVEALEHQADADRAVAHDSDA